MRECRSRAALAAGGRDPAAGDDACGGVRRGQRVAAVAREQLAAFLADVGLHLVGLRAQLAVDLCAVLVVDAERDHEPGQRDRERRQQRGAERDLRAQALSRAQHETDAADGVHEPRLAHLAAHVADEHVD